MSKTTPWPDTTEDGSLPDWFAAEQDEAHRRMLSDPALLHARDLSLINFLMTPLRDDVARGRKVRHADRLPKTEKPVGRPQGISNRDWDVPPSEVAEYYRRMKRKPGITKRDAMRDTCAHYGEPQPTTDKQCDKLVKTLDGWAAKEWTADDNDAYEYRNATRPARRKREAREPKSNKRKRQHNSLGAQFSEGDTGRKVGDWSPF